MSTSTPATAATTASGRGVEHPSGVLKAVFGFVKVRYRGMLKNSNRLFGNPGLTLQSLALGFARE